MENSILYRKIIHEVGRSFSYNGNAPFTQPLHYHNECELIFITAGSGKEYIGDAVNDYNIGDLTLIGSNTPHLHLCNSQMNNKQEKSSCNILQFPLSVFPSNMNEIQEFYEIYVLLKESVHGIRFKLGNDVKKINRIMNRINHERGIKRIIYLYEILDILCKCQYRQIISSNVPILASDSTEQDPVDKVYSYIRSNFKKTVQLKFISEYVGLNPTSLCRLFKQKTGKTIFGVLNETRVEYACKLLLYSNLTNSEIAYTIGFNNISYFNKVFKSIIKQTPIEYKNSIKKNLKSIE